MIPPVSTTSSPREEPADAPNPWLQLLAAIGRHLLTTRINLLVRMTIKQTEDCLNAARVLVAL
jgi:hypothetical protein